MEGTTKIVKVFDAADHATYDALEYRFLADSGEEITQLFSLQNEEPEKIIAELERGGESYILRDAEYHSEGWRTTEDYIIEQGAKAWCAADAMDKDAAREAAEQALRNLLGDIDYIVRIL